MTKVVPALARMSAALAEPLVRTIAAQPSAMLRTLNERSFFIVLFLSCPDARHPNWLQLMTVMVIGRRYLWAISRHHITEGKSPKGYNTDRGSRWVK